MRPPRRKAPVRRGTQPVPALERQPRGPQHLGPAAAERQSPGSVTPSPAWPPVIATPSVGVPFHRTSEYLHHVHHTTGFDREEIIDLCIRINSVQPGAGSPSWPPCLGLFKSVVAALTYMRHNRTQAEIGESFGVSQPTISRAISAIVPLVPQAVSEFVPTADDLDPRITSQPSRSQAARRPATQRLPRPVTQRGRPTPGRHAEPSHGRQPGRG